MHSYQIFDAIKLVIDDRIVFAVIYLLHVQSPPPMLRGHRRTPLPIDMGSPKYFIEREHNITQGSTYMQGLPST